MGDSVAVSPRILRIFHLSSPWKPVPCPLNHSPLPVRLPAGQAGQTGLEGESQTCLAGRQEPSREAKSDAVGGVGSEPSGLARANGLPGQTRGTFNCLSPLPEEFVGLPPIRLWNNDDGDPFAEAGPSDAAGRTARPDNTAEQHG